MSRINFAHFVLSDLKLVQPTDHYAATHRRLLQMGDQLTQLENEYCWTAWKDGVPLICSGIVTDIDEVWALVDRRANLRDMRWVTRFAINVLEFYTLMEHRPVFALIDKRYEPAITWAKHLGFRPYDEKTWVYTGIL